MGFDSEDADVAMDEDEITLGDIIGDEDDEIDDAPLKPHKVGVNIKHFISNQTGEANYLG